MTIQVLTALAVFFISVLVRVLAFPGEVSIAARKPPAYSYLLKIHLLSGLLYAGWIVYGIVRSDIVIVLAQGVGLMSSVVLSGHMFLRYRRDR